MASSAAETHFTRLRSIETAATDLLISLKLPETLYFPKAKSVKSVLGSSRPANRAFYAEGASQGFSRPGQPRRPVGTLILRPGRISLPI